MNKNVGGVTVPLSSFLNVKVGDLQRDGAAASKQRDTYRVSVEGIVNASNDTSPQIIDKPYFGSKTKSVPDYRIDCPFTVKKRAFNNITYQPEQNSNKEAGASQQSRASLIDLLQPEQAHAKSIDNFGQLHQASSDVLNSKQLNSKRSSVLCNSQYGSPQKSCQSPSQKSAAKSDCKSPQTEKSKRKKKDKENYDQRSIQKSPALHHPDQKSAKKQLEMTASLSPSKFEQFIRIDSDSLKNPFVQRKQSDIFERAIQQQLDKIPKTTKHFTQSEFYHKKCQETNRTRRWSSQTEQELSLLTQVQSKEGSGLKLTLNKISPTDDGFHEEEGIFEQSPSKEAELEDSPDNIVKRLIRKTNKSKEFHRTTYRRHLAQKITESMDEVCDEKQPVAAAQQPEILRTTNIVQPDNDLMVIPEESQSHLGDEQVSSFQNQQSNSEIQEKQETKPAKAAANDRLRQSFENPPTVITAKEGDQDLDKKSITFTELEMQINLIQREDEDMRAQLDELVVPDVPRPVDLISGCSLNTEKMYMAYKKMFDTSASKNINGTVYSTTQNNDQLQFENDLLKDSLDGASPSQIEFIQHERQIEQNMKHGGTKQNKSIQILDQQNPQKMGAEQQTRKISYAQKLDLNTSYALPRNMSEDSPSPQYEAATHQFLTNKYSPVKRAQVDHIKSCHIDEEQHYQKEIDKLKDELDHLKHAENELIHERKQSMGDKIQVQNAQVSDTASLVQEELLNKSQESKKNNQDEEPLPADVGQGLFKDQEEYDNAKSEIDGESPQHDQKLEEFVNQIDELNDNINIMSSTGDSPPILRLQPSPITEQENEYDSPVRTFRREQSMECNPLLTTDKNDDHIKNRMTSKIYFQNSLDSPPTKTAKLSKQNSLNLRKLVNQVQIVEEQEEYDANENCINLQVFDSVSQGSNGQNGISSKRELFQLQMIPVEVNGRSPSPSLSPPRNKLNPRFNCELLNLPGLGQATNQVTAYQDELDPIDLSSPCSFVLKPKKVESSPVKSCKDEIVKPVPQLNVAETAAQNQFSDQKRISKRERTKRSERKMLVREVNQEQINEDQDDGQKEHDNSKRMRRSRKSRSGSTTMTQLNQMIRKPKQIQEPDMQKVNLEVINKQKQEIQEQGFQSVNRTPMDVAVMFKTPDTQQMFDKKFEMTEESQSIQSSAARFVNQIKDDSIEFREDSLSLGLQTRLNDHNNSKSMNQSPNTKKEQLLMNPQIMISRNHAQSKYKKGKTNDACFKDSERLIEKQLENQEVESPWPPVIGEYNSMKSNTSRSSLYNRQMLKQQKEPVDEDCNIQPRPSTIEPSSPQILNLQQKNEKTEIELYQEANMMVPQRNSFVQNNTDMNKQFDQPSMAIEPSSAAMELPSEQYSARKATILNAESMLARNMVDNKQKDLQAQTISIAQSIKNKRRLNASSYVLGVGKSNNYKPQQQPQQMNSFAGTESADKPATSVFAKSKLSSSKYATKQRSENTAKSSNPPQHHELIHVKSQYCEEFNIQNPFNLDNSQPASDHQGKFSNTQQFASLVHPQSVPAQPPSLIEYLNNTQQIEKKGQRQSAQRRFKASEQASNKANLDVAEMQRVTQNVKKKIQDKYGQSKSSTGQAGQTNAQKYYNSIHTNMKKQQVPGFSKKNEDTNGKFYHNKSQVVKNSRERLHTDEDEQHAMSNEKQKYFNKPEDLRSKSNSNIGRGLYQTKQSAANNRSSMSLHDKGKNKFENVSQQHLSAERRRGFNLNVNTNLSKNGSQGTFMKQSSSFSLLPGTIQVQKQGASGQTYKNLAAGSKRDHVSITPTYCQPTSSFNQKKSAPAAPQISYKQSKSPFRNDEQQKSHMKTRNVHLSNTQQHACHKATSSNNSQTFEQLFKNELMNQGFSTKQFVFITNNNDNEGFVKPAGSQKNQQSVSQQPTQFNSNRQNHNFKKQSSVQGPNATHCGHGHGLTKTTSYSTKFNAVRRSQIIQKQKDSPRKNTKTGNQSYQMGIGAHHEHSLKMTAKRYSVGSNSAKDNHCHQLRRDASHNFIQNHK